MSPPRHRRGISTRLLINFGAFIFMIVNLILLVFARQSSVKVGSLGLLVVTGFVWLLIRSKQDGPESDQGDIKSCPSAFEKIFEGLAVAVFSLLVFFICLEMVTRILIFTGVFIELPKVYEMRNNYWYYPQSPFPAFYRNIAPFAFEDVPDLEYHLPEDVTSLYFNVSGHRRLTTDQPADYDHTIFLFGGSTLFCLEVPDDYTIPSYLQRMINEAEEGNFRVVNLGVPGFGTDAQLMLLKTIDFSSGDIVVFYDGANNAQLISTFSPGRLNQPVEKFIDANMTPEELKKQQRLTQINQRVIRVLNNLSYYSRFLQYLQMYRWDIVFDPDMNQKAYDQAVAWSVETFRADVLEANAYLAGLDDEVLFLHFLQPVLFTLDQPTPREQLILNTYGQDFTYRRTFEEFVTLTDDFRAAGIEAFDLTDVLDVQNPSGVEGFYFDYCHVNHTANEIIAREIFIRLAPYLGME